MARSRPPPDTHPPRPTSPSSHRTRSHPPPDTHPPRPTSPSSHRRSRPQVSYPTHLTSPSSSRPMTRSRPRPRLLDSYQLKGSEGSELMIYPGDTVVMRANDPTEKQYIARIEKIEGCDAQSHATVYVRWYYRPEETVGGRQSFHGSKELFQSDHTDFQSVDTIEGKCKIHTIEDYSKLKSVDEADFFCRFEYKSATGTFVPESTDKFCKCQQQYNPDEFMIQCESCFNWYHPPCIGLSTEEMKTLSQFCCQSCSDEANTEMPRKVSNHSENKACEDLRKEGAVVLPAKEQGFETANNPAEACDELRKEVATVLSAKGQGFECANKPADGVKDHLPEIQDLFLKYDKIWLEHVDTSNQNIRAAVNSLLNESSTKLKELHGKMTQDLIADIKLTLSTSNTRNEIAEAINPHEPPSENCSLVALIYDDRMLSHAPPKHVDVPDMPERISCIMNKLIDNGLADRCKIFSSILATIDNLIEVHHPKHVNFVDSKSSKTKVAVKNGDMFYNEGTSTAARLAAGSVIQACDLVVSGGFKFSFAIIRPPGHHVGKKGPPAGFCWLNNISVGAAHLLKHHQMKRVLILDFDIHHGDGTEEIFCEDNRVLFFSIHRADDDFYPGKTSGDLDNVGQGAGIGYNINVCWQHSDINDADYAAVWDYLLLPVVNEFKPQIILISAGFDAAAGDRLGQCNVTPAGYANMIEKLTSYPIVMALEGGYNLKDISESAAACVGALLGDKTHVLEEKVPYDTTYKMINDVRDYHIKEPLFL